MFAKIWDLKHLCTFKKKGKILMYSFNTIPIAEIVEGLNAASISVTENALKKPKPQSVSKIFKSYCMFLTGLNSTQIVRPDLQLSDDFEEELANGYSFLNCFRKLNEIAQAATIKDFSLKDFYAPTPQRLKHLFSGFMNFAFYEQEKLTLFTQLNERRAEIQSKNQELMEIIGQLKAQITAKQDELHEKTRKLESVKSDQNSLKDQIADLEDGQKAFQDEIKKLLQKQEEIQQINQDIENRIISAKNEIDLLNTQLEFDPLQIEDIIQRATNELDEVQEEATKVESKHKISKGKLEFINKNREKLIDALERCHPILNDFKKQAEVQEEAKQLEFLRKDLADMRSRVASLREKKAANDQEKQKQDATYNEVNQKIKAQKREQRKLHQQKKNSVFDMDDKISAFRSQINDYFDSLSRSMKEVEGIQLEQ